jgi:uncharacterized membrane protein
LLLNQLPWGVSLWPIVVSLAGIFLAGSLAAIYRRSQLRPAARFPITIQISAAGWWANQDRTNRMIYLILILALSAASLSFVVMVGSPSPSDYFTEFYLLGPQGQAEGFPREGQVGQSLSITVGVKNQESVAGNYRIEIQQDQQIVGDGSFSYEPREILQTPEFMPVTWGRWRSVSALRNGEPEPYRTLHLRMKITRDG